MAKKAHEYTDITREVVITVKKLVEEALVRTEAKKKVAGESLAAHWLSVLSSSNTSQQNYDHYKQWVDYSSQHDCCLSDLFRDFFVPLANVHKFDLVEEARNLITKEYKLKMLDPMPNEPTETQRGAGSGEQIRTVRRSKAKRLKLLYQCSPF